MCTPKGNSTYWRYRIPSQQHPVIHHLTLCKTEEVSWNLWTKRNPVQARAAGLTVLICLCVFHVDHFWDANAHTSNMQNNDEMDYISVFWDSWAQTVMIRKKNAWEDVCCHSESCTIGFSLMMLKSGHLQKVATWLCLLSLSQSLSTSSSSSFSCRAAIFPRCNSRMTNGCLKSSLRGLLSLCAVCVSGVCVRVNIWELEWEKREAKEHQPTRTDLLFEALHEENIYFGELA